MDWDQLLLVIVWLTAPPSVGFVVVYGLTTKWWRNGFLGYALLISSFGLAVLTTNALIARVIGQPMPVQLLTIIFTVIMLGAWLKFIALLIEKWYGRKYSYHPKHGYTKQSSSQQWDHGNTEKKETRQDE